MKGEVGEVLSGELSTKKHKVKIVFNTPQDPGFEYSAAIYPGGKTTFNLTSELESKFADASLIDKKAEAAADSDIKSENDFFDFYVQFKIKMAGDYSAQAAELQKCCDKFDIRSPGAVQGSNWFKFKIV